MGLTRVGRCVEPHELRPCSQLSTLSHNAEYSQTHLRIISELHETPIRFSDANPPVNYFVSHCVNFPLFASINARSDRGAYAAEVEPHSRLSRASRLKIIPCGEDLRLAGKLISLLKEPELIVLPTSVNEGRLTANLPSIAQVDRTFNRRRCSLSRRTGSGDSLTALRNRDSLIPDPSCSLSARPTRNGNEWDTRNSFAENRIHVENRNAGSNEQSRDGQGLSCLATIDGCKHHIDVTSMFN